MSEVFDPNLPELGEHDPRLCPGDGTWEPGDEVFEWSPPQPLTRVHDWQGGGYHGSTVYQRYCRWCSVSADAVRDRFREWRYEQLVEGLTKAVTALTAAIERKNW